MLTTNRISTFLVVAVALGIVAFAKTHRAAPSVAPKIESTEMYSNGDGIWHSVNGDPDVYVPAIFPKGPPFAYPGTVNNSTAVLWLDVCDADLVANSTVPHCARLWNW